MRGADHWAVAVRKPAGDIHVESHDIDSIAKRHPLFAKPFLRGILVLGQSLSIGTRALLIATNQSMDDDEQLTSRQVGFALALAMIFFVAIFVLGPTVLFAWVQRSVGGGVLTNILEGLFRVALFVGLPLVDRQDEGHPSRVRVPRSRAQDDRGVRARRPARPRARRSILHRPCPMRHELPDHRHGHHHLRVHAVRDAGVLVADRITRDRHPVDRGRRVRGVASGSSVPDPRS